MAAARVEQARALAGVAGADFWPQIGYNLNASRQRQAVPGAEGPSTFNLFGAAASVAWEVDIWGRIRRSTEAAKADLFAAEEYRRGVLLTLVSSVAQGYIQLLEFDRQLEIARTTTASYQKTLDLFTRRYDRGVDTKLSVMRATANLAEAAAAIAGTEQQIAAQENELCVLLGRLPGPIPRGAPPERIEPPSVPSGLPSQLLERRPDIRQAEAAVIGANARVGVAIANFFPQIGLTGLFGAASPELDNLLANQSMIWSAGGTFAGPIFQGGRLAGSYRAQKAQWEEIELAYRKTVLQAFSEVATVLNSRVKLAEIRRQRENDVEALRESVRLATSRYTMGLSNYYEVLEAQQLLFPAENALAAAVANQMLAVVALYRALGGGWDLGDEWTQPGNGE